MPSIFLNRSKPINDDPFWIVNEFDEEMHRWKKVYLGTDVNEAIEAAVEKGMARQDAVETAQRAIQRCKGVNDEITMAEHNNKVALEELYKGK